MLPEYSTLIYMHIYIISNINIIYAVEHIHNVLGCSRVKLESFIPHFVIFTSNVAPK